MCPKQKVLGFSLKKKKKRKMSTFEKEYEKIAE